MGVKERARELMKAAGVPILPGSDGVLKTGEEARETARTIGFPVILKASAGGGGRGMRVVQDESQLEHLFAQARAEAEAAFGVPDVYLEKYITAPRHIEFQILADEHGNVEILGERECSIQRRHQKLIEEAPSPVLKQETRVAVMARLQEAVREVGYTNAGTAEFLMDDAGNLNFIEVNARIQVEHPVTEAITGVDLVKSQILVAGGARLGEILGGPVTLRGHAIECRINAEHPETFAPCPGRVTGLNIPGGIGVRVDTALYTDGVVPPYYDSLVAKIIAMGRDREEARVRMLRALEMFVVEGIYTSVPLHQRILSDNGFIRAEFDTNYIGRLLG
jgi:acetyl-CoA carboxylase biotin carboxylase subunit